MWIPTRNPAGGLGGGGRCEPRSGVRGSAPEIFEIYGFLHLRGPILSKFRELLGVLLQKFSANERLVCNIIDCLLPSLVCVWTGRHRNSSPCFLSANQMSIGINTCCVLLLNLDLAAAEQRQDSRFLQHGQRRFTFPPQTGVPPALHESS